MSIYVTGDTHGSLDIQKLSRKNWPPGHTLTKKDFVIILGDFGLVWHNPPSKEEVYWLKWLKNSNWTTLWLDGNHENHELIAQLHDRTMFVGMVGKVCDSVYHLRRGQVYTIDGKRIFTFGGALSIDKEGRTIGKSWWPGEIPTYAEMNTGLRRLECYQYNVDYILTHTAPINAANNLITYIAKKEGISPRYLQDGKEKDPTCQYLQSIADSTTYKKWFCGHWHEDIQFDKLCFVYKEIHKLV